MLALVSMAFVASQLSRDDINFRKTNKKMQLTLDKVSHVLMSERSELRKKAKIRRLLAGFLPPRTESRRRPHRDVHPLYIVDDKGQDFRGHALPDALSALVNRSKQSSKMLMVTQGDWAFFGPRTIVLDGESRQLFVSQFIGRFRVQMIFHIVKSVSPLHLLLFLVLSAALCFALAWSITKPIISLRKISLQLANGEPVSAQAMMGKRRDEFYDLAVDFDAMAKKILQTLAAQKQLLSDVSHELRSPLARIQLAAGLLERKQDEESAAYVERIELECERMNEMLTHLLKIAALERGERFEQKAAFSLNKLLAELTNDLSFEAEQKQITIQVSCQTEVSVLGYFALMRSAVENIIRNSIRHAPPSSQIEVRLTKETNASGEDKAVMVFADHGPGVPEDELENIFQAFYRLDTARTPEQSGSGLGLSIAAKAVALHHGKIKASQNLPQGLVISIELPLVN